MEWKTTFFIFFRTESFAKGDSKQADCLANLLKK